MNSGYAVGQLFFYITPIIPSNAQWDNIRISVRIEMTIKSLKL